MHLPTITEVSGQINLLYTGVSIMIPSSAFQKVYLLN